MTLGMMHATDKFVREEPGEFGGPFVRQMTIIDANPDVVELGKFPRIVEGNERRGRGRLPETGC